MGLYNGDVRVDDTFFMTKIMATVGPACADQAALVRLIQEGARCFRLNFSHGSFDDHHRMLKTIRAAADQTDIDVGVLGDLRGPKIRTGRLAEGPIDLEPGDHVEILAKDVDGYRDATSQVVYIPSTYENLVEEVGPGHRVLIDDGAIHLLCTDRLTVGQVNDALGPRLICSVTTPNTLKANKGINLPDSKISASSLTDFDHECVQWAIENQLDYLALSFVRCGDDVTQLKGLLADQLSRGVASPPIIAKIETPQATRNIDDICDQADGIMVARGDLGVEMDLAQVPVVQKQVIASAHDHGKPVIVATQMLQSMIDQPQPTRAEVSDVANAIIDGADAVMLSGETAVGSHATAAVHVMAHTARVVGRYDRATRKGSFSPPRMLQASRYRTAAIGHAAGVMVHDLGARYVVLWSELGGGARYISQNRIEVPIIAVSSNRAALRRMSLMYGVHPAWMARPENSNEFTHEADKLLIERGWAKAGDPVVMVQGEPLGTPGVTNQLRIHYVGDVVNVRWRARAT